MRLPCFARIGCHAVDERGPQAGIYALSAMSSAMSRPCSRTPGALYPDGPGPHRRCRGRPCGPAAGLKPLPSLEESPLQVLTVYGLNVDGLNSVDFCSR